MHQVIPQFNAGSTLVVFCEFTCGPYAIAMCLIPFSHKKSTLKGKNLFLWTY